MRKSYTIGKRALDILGSLFAILAFSTVAIYIAIRIKAEDSGPIFYSQERVGEHGRVFKLYKFRSMVVGAHSMKSELVLENEADGPLFKIKDDPRVTKVGKFIRRHSFDEIPQFFNVLRGDMSLVGPRPALPEEVASYSAHDRLRLNTIPGMTGLWQVSGRSNLTYHQMISLDIQYVDNKSFLLDVKILFLTVFQIFNNDSGAY